jgi:hypothetical protein
MQPNFPLYIVSKGRAESRLTARALEAMAVPYFIVVEAQEHSAYASVIDRSKVLVLDPRFQAEYDTCDDLGDGKSKGPGPARNFAWQHAIEAGAAFHWVMDDNIRCFHRLHRNAKIRFGDGSGFRAMEDFVQRYANVSMAGPNYSAFAKQRQPIPPFILNTRIYSCNLIRNDVPFRWRGRYNEDTDLSLCMLKAGWVTVQFNAFLQAKLRTQVLKGGNTAEFYANEGTLPKSRMLVQLHPDVARLAWKFQRWHHEVDYSVFRNKLVRDASVTVEPDADCYGLELRQLGASGKAAA